MPREAKAKAEEMCKRLLANPIKDNYTIALEEQK
jgi:phosphoribosylformylglycinamidine (FGAM) synthase PurS component